MILLDNSVDILSILKNASIPITLIQLLLGGLVSYFKWWIIEIESFKKRIKLCVEIYSEEMADLFVSIFDRKLNTDIPLRGQPPDYTDIVVKFINKQFISSNKYVEVNELYKSYKKYNAFLFFTTMVGIVLLLLSIFIKELQIYITYVSTCFVLLQIFTIYKMNEKVNKLEKLEQTH
jgi:hypothetical protein